MSTSSADPVSLLSKISPSILVEYANYHGIVLKLSKEMEGGEQCAHHVLSLIEKEPEDKQGDFLMDLDDLNAMGKETICERIANDLRAQGNPLDDELVEGFGHWNDWSMHYYLHHKDLFYKTFDSCTLDMKQGWRGRKTVVVPFGIFIKNIKDFKNALKELYSQEYKGKKIQIRYTDKGDRVIFTAHIQGVFTVDSAFKQDNEELQNNKRKPVFPINFLYRPEAGVLEVKAKGGKTRVKELQYIFIEHFLKDDPKKFQDVPRCNFDKVQDLQTLKFPVRAEDNVESVILNGVKVTSDEHDLTLKIDIDPDEGSGVQPMLDTLEARNISLNDFEITQFKVKILFKKPSKGRQRSVTTTITNPDGCNLKQRNIDMTVYSLLKRWGLIFY